MEVLEECGVPLRETVRQVRERLEGPGDLYPFESPRAEVPERLYLLAPAPWPEGEFRIDPEA